MRLVLCSLVLVLFSTSLYGQPISMVVCNDADDITGRNECIKGYIETSIHNVLKPKADSLQTSISVRARIYTDAIGNFYIKEVEESFPNSRSYVERALQNIKPIASYRNKRGKLLENIFSIEVTAKPGKKKSSTSDTLAKEKEEKEEKKDDAPFSTIEEVPIFPSCEGSDNLEYKRCMSNKLNKHININFNKDIATRLNLDPGIQRINIQFKIDTQGYPANVRCRGPHPDLEAEAIRVVKSLPRMKPGKQRGKEVGVLYGVPILFQVEDDKPKKKKRKGKG